MAEAIIMPKYEMSQEIGTIVEWTKQEGDPVKKGEIILVVETDKVTMDVECPATGIIAGMRGEPGEQIPVTEIIGYVLQPGEELPAAKTSEAKQQAPAEESKGSEATPVAKRMAEEAGLDVAAIQGTGPGGKVTKTDVENALVGEEKAPAGIEETGKVRATPAARRIARENEIDLSNVAGSGPRDRVQAADVLHAAAAAPAPVRAVRQAGEAIPFTGMRKKIADRMQASYQTAPHVYMTIKADMSIFQDFRSRLNARADKEGTAHFSATALLVKAVSWALLRNPILNSALSGDSIKMQAETNIGVAVALDEGLIVPVVRNVEQLGLAEIAETVNDVVQRARKNALTPAEVAGGTFTISNLGTFGIEQFTAIINPGQTAILAVGAIQEEVVPDGDGDIDIVPMMRMTLGLDHRVADGASGARFMADLRDALQEPELMLW
ncbi:MAG: 2-oxo acid dehydrogenase subunit E2 [Anaerolineaceae bacterium]|jgi:pyruvate dehydrogenase E2 component (dihydrolipoamide acetyltransferase)|nr:2-oxo acid dehydrogenase subunit E2 [Anaerolineaceae bacterium]